MCAGGEIGALRVGAMALAAETLLVNSLARLSDSHPNLQIDVLVGGSDIYRELSVGECDLVVDMETFRATIEGTAYGYDESIKVL